MAIGLIVSFGLLMLLLLVVDACAKNRAPVGEIAKRTPFTGESLEPSTREVFDIITKLIQSDTSIEASKILPHDTLRQLGYCKDWGVNQSLDLCDIVFTRFSISDERLEFDKVSDIVEYVIRYQSNSQQHAK